MRNKSLLISGPLIVVVSAAIAYGLVFKTTWFGGRYVDEFSGGNGTEYGYELEQVQELAKLQPEEFQKRVEALFDDLLKLSEAQLAMLNAAGDDVCLSPLIYCQGVPGKNVKPFVERALAYKQSRETASIAFGSLDTARLSLAVAFAAFIVSVIGLFVKRA